MMKGGCGANRPDKLGLSSQSAEAESKTMREIFRREEGGVGWVGVHMSAAVWSISCFMLSHGRVSSQNTQMEMVGCSLTRFLFIYSDRASNMDTSLL